MSLRYATLALLAAEPMTGYQLVRYFDDTVSLLWAASHSQIYPELKRMEADGLIVAETLPRGERAEKRRYDITERGRAELRDWAGRPLPYSPERDAHRLQVAYGEYVDLARLRKLLTDHLDHYTWRRSQWSKLLQTISEVSFPLLQSRLDRTDPELRHRVVAFKELALSGQVAYADTEIEWARRGLELLDQLEAEEAQKTEKAQADDAQLTEASEVVDAAKGPTKANSKRTSRDTRRSRMSRKDSGGTSKTAGG